MKKSMALLLLAVLLAFLKSAIAQDYPLKFRGYAGLVPRAVTPALADSLKLVDQNGAVITRVVPNSPAQRAGIQNGDIILKYDDHSILDDTHLISLTRTFNAGDRIRVTLWRKGKIHKAILQLDAFPRETSGEVDIDYTSFARQDIRFRAVVTSPLNSKNKKLPALLLVSALSSPRLIAYPGYAVVRELAYAISKAGFRVLRFELRGAGDSEGDDYRLTDFNTEVADNLAALRYLAQREDVDSTHIFLYGESTGGIIAAMLASQEKTAGLITSCTVGRTYYERLMETVRLQMEFAGDSKMEIDKQLKDYLFLTTAVAFGDSLPVIIAKAPDVKIFVNKYGRIMDDRSIDYWRQQLNLNLSVVYSQISEPVLIIYGESDFLTQRACHEHIRDVLITAGNANVKLTVLPDLDHVYAYAKDKRASYENYKKGNFRLNPIVFEEIIKWLRQQSGIERYL